MRFMASKNDSYHKNKKKKTRKQVCLIKELMQASISVRLQVIEGITTHHMITKTISKPLRATEGMKRHQRAI